jgi:Lrp/AsnC ligand binding domain
MVEAIVLVQVKVGRSSAVARAVGEMGGVTEAYVVTGPYDLIARVEADSLDELGPDGRLEHPGGGGRLANPDLPDPGPLSRRSRRTHHGEVGDGGSRQSLELVIGDAHRHAERPGLGHDPLVLAEGEVDVHG